MRAEAWHICAITQAYNLIGLKIIHKLTKSQSSVVVMGWVCVRVWDD
jgi:hypothetical protein